MLIRQRECHSYYRDVYTLMLATTPLDATKKMNMLIFRRSGIEAESQSNRNIAIAA